MYGYWDMVRNGRMDRQTDGRKKKGHMEVDAPCKKCYREKRSNLWNIAINWGTKPVLQSHLLNHWKSLVSDPMHDSWILCQKERDLDCFLSPYFIKSGKMIGVIFFLASSRKWPVWKFLYIYSHEEIRNTKFRQQVSFKWFYSVLCLRGLWRNYLIIKWP